MIKLITNVFLITVLLLTSQIANSTTLSDSLKSQNDTTLLTTNSLDFFVLGDWGSGDANQLKVANAMTNEARQAPIDFIVSVGDNFYPHGVRGLNHKHWTNYFENVYTDSSLQKDWYTAMGNHDYMGSVNTQLKYYKKNPRWKSTERYYSFSQPIPESKDSVLFVIIDTNPFDKTMSKIQGALWLQNKKKQLEWLDEVLENSDAKWKIVVGHHPLFTTGFRRGKMDDIRIPFLPIFEKHKVDVYFAGHDHDLQHQKPAGHTHYFVSGAGSEFRGVTQDPEMTKLAVKDLGFMRASISENRIEVTVINGDNKELHFFGLDKE